MTAPQVLRRALEHHHAGRRAEAEEGYREYLSHDPSHPEVWNNFALVALDLGQPAVALERATRAVALVPGHPNFRSTQACALNALGRPLEALAACFQVLQSQPQFAPAWFGIGDARMRLGEDEAAIAAYRRALELKPDYAAAANNLANLLLKTGDLDGAAATFRSLIAMAPDFAVAHNNLGETLRELGRYPEALACFRRALECEPGLARVHSNVIMALPYMAGTTADILAEEKRNWWATHGAPHFQRGQHFPNDRNPERKLRIGYVSADFRAHPVGRHLLPILRQHHPDHFAVTAYSSVRVVDQITERFRELPIQWRDVEALTDDALAAQIRADRIDVLVDLSLYSAGDRLQVFARQPAPVQISFGGYPGATGLESIGWHITDPVLEPAGSDADGKGSTALRLPHSFWCMEAPDDAPECSSLPALRGGPFVFGCLHKFTKINEPLLDLWGQILRALPQARLHMQCPAGESHARILTHFGARGVSAGRLTLVPFLTREDYLACYRNLDMVLDTFPYNGHVTALDALWMGVPFVTLAGELPVSRGGASILTKVGLPELIARTPEDYIRIAVELAGDLPRLAGLRASMRDRMKASPLMDTARFTRNVEEAYRTAWRSWCASASPPSPL